jgi:hypothetical protein
VDGRIFYVGGRQLSAIRTQDLPMLAKAIVGYARGMVSVERCIHRLVQYVRFYANEQAGGQRFEFNVLASDWAKLYPYLSGQPVNTPGPSSPLLTQSVIKNSNTNDLSNLEQWDPVYYAKVYATLQTIFTQSYPTSNL